MDETNCRVVATRICSSRERPPTRWTNVFVKRINQLYSYLHSHQVYSYQPIFYRSRYETRASGHARMKPPPWATVARTRDEWNMCRGLHNSEGVSSKYPKPNSFFANRQNYTLAVTTTTIRFMCTWPIIVANDFQKSYNYNFVKDEPLIEDSSWYVYAGRSLNMEINMKEDFGGRRKTACAAFRPLKEAADQITDRKLRANLFD
ncbi:hypothetical protein KIN20_036389 [Parelaphostrongylus tenuis]|uniref:Uncharacterized protein n=1 Tax=Parelaphostrongylus tenuis TaxID=148309 RepID=A0AAD5RCV3_PARTN|nr:hypothetical protein KIN20_036389 [Parelaphostrongylus tenuis]